MSRKERLKILVFLAQEAWGRLVERPDLIVSVERAMSEVEAFDTKSLKSLKDVRAAIEKWHKAMLMAAKEQDFEEAAIMRDRVRALKQLELQILQQEAG